MSLENYRNLRWRGKELCGWGRTWSPQRHSGDELVCTCSCAYVREKASEWFSSVNNSIPFRLPNPFLISQQLCVIYYVLDPPELLHFRLFLCGMCCLKHIIPQSSFRVNWPDTLQYSWLYFPFQYPIIMNQWQMQVGPLCTKQFTHFHLATNSVRAMCRYWHNGTIELAPAHTQLRTLETNEVFHIYCWDLSCVCLCFCAHMCVCMCVYM